MLEYASDHPAATTNGYVYQHRLVMECVLGRLLERSELVHHQDHDPGNNWPENLELVSPSEHAHEHQDDRYHRPPVPLTERQVREALVGRTTAEAAKHLGCSSQVLYDRFDHLLTKRRSPGAPLPPGELAVLAALAADPDVTLPDAGRTMRHSPQWVTKECRRAGLAWVYRKGRKVGATDLQPRARRGTGSRRRAGQARG